MECTSSKSILLSHGLYSIFPFIKDLSLTFLWTLFWVCQGWKGKISIFLFLTNSQLWLILLLVISVTKIHMLYPYFLRIKINCMILPRPEWVIINLSFLATFGKTCGSTWDYFLLVTPKSVVKIIFSIELWVLCLGYGQGKARVLGRIITINLVCI